MYPDYIHRKKHIRFENTPRCIPEFLLWWVHIQGSQKSMECPNEHYLTSWPWPVTYDLDIRFWPRYPPTWPACKNSSPYVCPFSRESDNRQTDDVKTITPITSEAWGVINTWTKQCPCFAWKFSTMYCCFAPALGTSYRTWKLTHHLSIGPDVNTLRECNENYTGPCHILYFWCHRKLISYYICFVFFLSELYAG